MITEHPESLEFHLEDGDYLMFILLYDGMPVNTSGSTVLGVNVLNDVEEFNIHDFVASSLGTTGFIITGIVKGTIK